MWFQNSGAHTIRVQVSEDGVEIDQIVISPVTYATNPPGPVSNDNTIVPKPNQAPAAPGSPNSGERRDRDRHEAHADVDVERCNELRRPLRHVGHAAAGFDRPDAGVVLARHAVEQHDVLLAGDRAQQQRNNQRAGVVIHDGCRRHHVHGYPDARLRVGNVEHRVHAGNIGRRELERLRLRAEHAGTALVGAGSGGLTGGLVQRADSRVSASGNGVRRYHARAGDTGDVLGCEEHRHGTVGDVARLARSTTSPEPRATTPALCSPGLSGELRRASRAAAT